MNQIAHTATGPLTERSQRFGVLLFGALLTACPSKPVEETAAPDTTDTAAQPDCDDSANGTLPDGVEWLSFDGKSTERFAFSDLAFAEDYAGYYGTYNLNTLEVYGGNGFKLERPAQIVGVQVAWTNLGLEPVEATVSLWPDFSSDGYAFASWAPYATGTRCLDAEDDGEWITYTLTEPFDISQPLHVFAGYYRPEVLDADQDGAYDFETPELLMENHFNGAEPYFAGVRWPELDDEYYYLGLVTAWYTWQVRLAVIYVDEIDPADQYFTLDEALSVGSRVAWGDYDGDGYDDLMSTGPTLYQNQGDGTFLDVTSTAIPEGTGNGSGGGVWGDYDGDGCLDYFGQGTSYSTGEVLLHSNCDGTFTDLWDSSGIIDLQTTRDCNGDGAEEYSPTEGAGWADFDGDGLLDLYLAEYECSSDFDYFLNYVDRAFINQGDGTFAEASGIGISVLPQAGRGVTTGDADRDGDTDIFVSNYRLDSNFFYENLGDGSFDEVGEENGTRGERSTLTGSASYGHTIGSVFGDIDNDGDFDLVQANLAHPFYYGFSQPTAIYINDGSGSYTNEAESRGIYYRETHSNPTLLDVDNDGDLDLFITSVYTGRDSDLYLNDGTGFFTLTNFESGAIVDNGWGAAASDFDNDGDVDWLAYDLYRNNGLHADEHHWIQVRAVGKGGNTSAIGAVIEVEAGALTQIRQVGGGSGTSSQDSFTAHFGLGSSDTNATVSVRFPYGDVVEISDVAVDQRIWVYSDGSYSTGFAPKSGRARAH